MYRLILAFFIISFSITQAAHAALLTNINGIAMVNKGSGFKAVATATEVGPGDRVMVKGDANAQIVFNGGCTLPVGPGSVVTVPAEAPCAPGSLEPAVPLDTAVVLGGLAVVGGGVGLAIALSNKGNPASP